MKSKFSILLALLFLTSSLISIKPVFSEEISETKWVLETIIIGEGGKQEAPEGTRGEGSYREYTVTEQGIIYHDRSTTGTGDVFLHTPAENTIATNDDLVPGFHQIDKTGLHTG